MRRHSLLLLSLICYALAVLSCASVVHKNNGRPGCQTQDELQVVNYRHFWNKSAYWKCVTLGEPALIQYCPPEQGYLDPVKACVPWSQWYWTHTDLPPSQPSA